ncbi:hypothetical protein IX317_000471 [Fusobacterium sp. DD29]|uniref:phage holin family protein n=1 Tax=unclassified Fusobacterium TaxID=2648384 RepID=UPI001B8B0248|nr:hypothetical protein [Fusobacterium sp. DD45]MBR8710328.1 hypothetical protein [Fusobacterium sp. DD28]MBR8748810.1 hypothetical protein [Fusobacterium sp. DD29]MBR8750943.1 hypothetical protein [Fusobacterium sp. DD26]MBR8761033.1 hypothetical protein [Fusobacterium sp. DD25]MBR8767089.1 hypothetical protein [Fusobacterium sp. DD43]MBR8771139.1 hypothetical protein [Fusobacterium sp. DD40]MBR8775365.1 hypothetical protein [Fusobacterium sp. DD17]MBR8797627.1 hypothetical protein [Fusoba
MDELNQIIELGKEIGKIIFNVFNLVLGGILTLIFYVTGGRDELVATLAIVMLTDYISGIIKSVITEKTNSRVGIKGALKKVMMVLVLTAVWKADEVLRGPIQFKNIITCIFIGNEVISIIENAIIAGIPIPECFRRQLEKRFEQIRDKKEDKK